MAGLTRRSLVATSTAVAVASGLSALVAERPDAHLVALGVKLDAVHAERTAFEAEDPQGDDYPLYERHWQLREAINQIPAISAAGLRVKARAARLALHHDPRNECDGDGSFRDLSCSLIDDLLTMSKGALDA